MELSNNIAGVAVKDMMEEMMVEEEEKVGGKVEEKTRKTGDREVERNEGPAAGILPIRGATWPSEPRWC